MLNTTTPVPVPIWRPLPICQKRQMRCSCSFYARRAHGEFASRRGEPSLPRCPRPPRPERAAPRLSQTLLIHLPLSTFPLKKRPGVTSEIAGQASDVLGAIRRHCCQTRPGAAYELTAANAIQKFNSKTAAVCGKSSIHSLYYSIFLFDTFFSHRFLHMTGLCCWHSCAKKNFNRCKDKQ